MSYATCESAEMRKRINKLDKVNKSVEKKQSDKMYLFMQTSHHSFCNKICMYVCMHVYMYVCMYVYICPKIYIAPSSDFKFSAKAQNVTNCRLAHEVLSGGSNRKYNGLDIWRDHDGSLFRTLGPE